MAKKSNQNNQKASKKNSESLSATMKVAIAGCLAECYLLLVQRFFVNGKIEQLVAMSDILRNLSYVGIAIFAIGVVWALLRRKKNPQLGVMVAGGGAFLFVANWICLNIFPVGTTALCVLVPLMTLLGIVFFLYQREFFYGVSVMGLAICNLWACRKALASSVWHVPLLVATALVIALLLLVMLAAHKLEQNKGKWGEKKLFPATTQYSVIYGSCALSVAALVLGVFSATIAYYAMWAVAVCLFALAVYYTVKQL